MVAASAAAPGASHLDIFPLLLPLPLPFAGGTQADPCCAWYTGQPMERWPPRHHSQTCARCGVPEQMVEQPFSALPKLKHKSMPPSDLLKRPSGWRSSTHARQLPP